MTVWDYFTKTFNTYHSMEDRQILMEMPLDSTCGKGCKDCIDAAEPMLKQIAEAFGYANHPKGFDHRQALANITASVCICFIRG